MQHSKRAFLKAGAGVAALAAVRRTAAQPAAPWQPSQRYPDPAIKIVAPGFARYRLALAKVERIASGMRWCEGPVWFGDGRYLLWSDIPNSRIMKWEEETGAVSVFRKPSNNANGNTRDRQGRLLTCEHDTRRVTRTEHDGTISVIAERYDVNRPNGLAFTPDESRLYIIEAGVTPRAVRLYDVVDGGTRLAKGRVFLTAEPGATPDGFRLGVCRKLLMRLGSGRVALQGVKILH